MELSPAAKRALSARQEQSVKTTRAKLEAALVRLINDSPLTAAKKARITPLLLCKEAGVDRSTLYRFHQPVLAEIRRIQEKLSRPNIDESRHDLAQTSTKLKEYRQLTEQAQLETAALARINYRLQARIYELEELLRSRDAVIRRHQES